MRKTRTRVIVLGLAVWILSAVSIGCERSSEPAVSCVSADNASTAKTLVGVIRFDTWPSNGPNLADQNLRQLDPAQWHYRLPFFGSATDGARVSMNENTVAVMDQELAYMVQAGLKWMAFNHQCTEMHGGIDAYTASTSPLKAEVKIALHESSVGGCRLTDAINIMNANRNNWLYVQGNRPVVFLQFGFNLTVPSEVTTYRQTVMANGFGAPYFVCLDFNSGAANTAGAAAALGCEAIGAYGSPVWPQPQNTPYAGWAAAQRPAWDQYAATGYKVVPFLVAGSDSRPRDGAGVGYVTQATPQELAAHMQDALNWAAQNPSSMAEGLFQWYAWNEITEGGWIVPSNPANNPCGTCRIDAIAAVLCTRCRRASPRPAWRGDREASVSSPGHAACKQRGGLERARNSDGTVISSYSHG